MELLYITDMHGIEWKYERVLQIANERNVAVVINGGDMLPKAADLMSQGYFITDFLGPHLKQYQELGLNYLCCLGNDDLKTFDETFKAVCDEFPCVHDMAQRKVDLFGYEFIGMNWVVDYPFRLKDRCRMDTVDYVFQEQLGSGLLSTELGMQEMDDWFTYAKTLPTIEEELDRLVTPNDMSKTIYSMHMPPAGMGLDQCHDGREVGSKAIYAFLKNNQPRLSLHGHIHESPLRSQVWCAKLGNTICVQPGQLADLHYALIDLESMECDLYIQAREETKPFKSR